MEIRLYSSEELHMMETDTVIGLLLHCQEQIKEQAARYEEIGHKLGNALEEIRLLKSKLYGRSSEKSSALEKEPCGRKKEDAESRSPSPDGSGGQPGREPETCCEKAKPRRRKGCMEAGRRGIPVIDVHDQLSREELDEKFPGMKVNEMPPSSYDIVRMIPPCCYVERHHVHVYKSGKQIVRAREVEKLLPGSDISTSTMAYILNARFSMNLPGNRVSAEMTRQGYPFSRQRIYSLTQRFAFGIFELVIERMKHHMFATGHIQADETPLTVHRGEGRGKTQQGRMWAYLTSERNDAGLPKVVMYQFSLTRKTENLEEHVRGFKGTITSDGYVSYRNVDRIAGNGITVTGCMTHCRRKYIDVLKAMTGFGSLTEEKKNEVPAYRASKLIGKIFDADGKLNGLPPDERLEKRRTDVAPAVEEFFAYIHSFKDGDFDKGGMMHKAVVYTKNQEKYLRRFLEDGRVPLENSASERAVIAVAVGRNGWKTISTVDGGTSLGYMYSISETAKQNGANPYYYFKYLLENGGRLQSEHADEPVSKLEYLDVLMPWSEEYKRYESSELRKDHDRIRLITENTKNTIFG